MKREKQRNKKRAGWLLFVFLCLGMNLWAMYELRQLGSFQNLITISCREGTVNGTKFWQWMEKEGQKSISEAALWSASGEYTIASESTGREQKVRGYRMQGEPGAVFGSALLEGRYFTTGEERVCLLDSDTAWKIFGTDQAAGLEVQIEGNTWRIAGILKERRPLCVMADQKDAVFDTVTIRKRDDRQSSNLMVSQLESVVDSAEKPFIDGKLYFVTAWLFWALTTSLLLLLFTGRLIRFQKNMPGTHPAVLVLILICLGAALLCLWYGVKTADPGSDYLPAYWSDLEFLGLLFQEKIKQIRDLSMHQEFTVWNNVLQIWRRVTVAEAVALSAGVVLYLYRRIHD